jgi:superfamily II DNA or RNA helicase
MKTSSSEKTGLLSYFDSWTRIKGDDYFRRNKVVSHSRRADGQIFGKVSGSGGKIYRTAISLDKAEARIVDTECSCPMVADCKHAAALVQAFLEASRLGQNDEVVVSIVEDDDEISWPGDHSGASSRKTIKPGPVAKTKGEPVKSVKSEDSRQVIVGNDSVKPGISRKDNSEPGKLDSYNSGSNTSGPNTSRPTVASPRLLPPPKDIAIDLRRVSQLYQSFSLRPSASQFRGELHNSSYKARSTIVYVLRSESWSTRPHIDLVRVSLRKDGSYGAESPYRLEQLERNPPAFALPEDLEIAELWRIVTSGGNYWSYSREEVKDPQLLAVLLTRIIRTNRSYCDSPQNSPLKLGPALPGQLYWQEEAGGKLRLAVVAKDGDKTYQCLRWRIPWYVDRQSGQCGPVSLDLSDEILDKLLSMRAISKAEAASLMPVLVELGLESLIPPPPGENAVVVRRVRPVPALSVKCLPSKAPLFEADGRMIPAGQVVRAAVLTSEFGHPDNYTFVDETGRTILEKHDLAADLAFGKRLNDFGFKETGAVNFVGRVGAERFFIAANQAAWLNFSETQLEALRAEGWSISPEVSSTVVPTEIGESSFLFDIEDGGQWWFSLSLNVDINGKKMPLLPILLSAIRALPADIDFEEAVENLNRDGKFLTILPDGSLVSLPFDRVKSILSAVQELIYPGQELGDLKLSVLHAAQLLQNGDFTNARWLGADRILRLVELLRDAGSIKAVLPPRSFEAELRPYQRDGLNWLQFLAHHEFGGILADDMGLGKTVQLLAHICLEKQKKRLKAPFLVVCPTSVLPNWISEIGRFAPSLKVVSFHGLDRHAYLDQCKRADVVVTTYPLLVRDVTVLQKIEWHGIALDEAQAIKNAATQIAQAARRLKASHRFCLSGTPIENHLGELWSQFNFLLPGLLGESASFNRNIRNPIEKEGNRRLKAALAGRIRPFVLRRTKQEVASDLPEKTVMTKLIELEGGQRELYETVRLASTKQVRDEIANKGFRQSQIMILDALLKLRQSCCDPRLVKLSAARKVKESAKLAQLMRMLQELVEEGRRIIVFSQFTSMLDLIAEDLQLTGLQFVELRGDTRDRRTPVEQFQSGAVPIFLISLKAGGTGLNLTAADVVVHYDPWWNPAVEDQATDRAHRIGQTKKVFVYKLIAQGTIEQKMLELQDRKRIIASSIYDDDGSVTPSFSEADLAALLEPIENFEN